MPVSDRTRGAARPTEPTEGPFLAFNLAEQIHSLRQEPYWQSGRNSKTIVKCHDLRIVLSAIQAKTTIRQHSSAGRMSVQTLEGHLRMHAGGKEFDMPAGRVLVLDRDMPHDVIALEDSAFLVTMAWPEGAEH